MYQRYILVRVNLDDNQVGVVLTAPNMKENVNNLYSNRYKSSGALLTPLQNIEIDGAAFQVTVSYIIYYVFFTELIFK